MRNKKSLTSSEPSVSSVMGIVRCIAQMPSGTASVELHILYKHGAEENLLALAVGTAEMRIGMAVTTAAE